MNVLAASGSIQEFERAFDNYQYSVTVEWDQKDESFFDAKTKEFTSTIKSMMEKGVRQEEILSVIASKTPNKEVFEALKLKVSLLSKNLSEEELLSEIKLISKDVYSRGSSWNGEAVFTYAFAALVIGALVYSIHWDLTHECVRTEYKYSCYNSCHGPMEYRWCDTHCGYGDVCVEYAKK